MQCSFLTYAFSVLGLPAISVPCGFTRDGCRWACRSWAAPRRGRGAARGRRVRGGPALGGRRPADRECLKRHERPPQRSGPRALSGWGGNGPQRTRGFCTLALRRRNRRPDLEDRAAMDFDLVIRGGTVVDGTGRRACAGDVGIRAAGSSRSARRRRRRPDDRRRRAGRRARASSTSTPTTTPRSCGTACSTLSPWHGVTTVVMGNCGFAVAPTRPDHRDLIMRTLEKVEGMSARRAAGRARRRLAVRDVPRVPRRRRGRGTRASTWRALIGHTPLRLYVMGEEATERAATAEEVARDARASCARRSTPARSASPPRRRPTHVGYGGKPVPSRAADFAEIRRSPGRSASAGTRHHAGHRRPRPVLHGVRRPRPGHRAAGDVDRAAGRHEGPGSPPRAAREGRARCVQQGLPVYPQVTCRPLQVRDPVGRSRSSTRACGVQADLGRRPDARQGADLRRPRVPARRSRRVGRPAAA